MPKKINKIVAPEKEPAACSDTECANELQKLAHAGTKEAVKKIEKYIKAEKDIEKRACAEIALEECEFLFYEPTNEKEEEEFMLCELIRRRERNVVDLIMKIGANKLRLEKLALEKKVHEKVIARCKDKREDWKYNWMMDFVIMEEQDLHKNEDEMAYDEAWIAEGKKMITTVRYKAVPVRHLEHFDFNFDKDFYDGCNDSCGCGGDCGEIGKDF
ncbi:hypothetical protein KKC87_01020 [Patescibacteria group bacterium]|nr:hypothetical protein [Patescibacteria group bacterium]